MAVTFSGGWSRLRNLFSTGATSNKEEGPQYSGPSSRGNDANVSYSDERALQCSPVWACIRLTTETVASLPLQVYERTQDGRQKIEDHYLSRLFHEAPNAIMTPMEFREAMIASLCLRGNAYAMIDWAGKPYESDAKSLVPLRADCMKPVRSGTDVTYHYQVEKGTHVFAKESILHIKGFGFDGVVGLSPLDFMAQSLGVSISAEKHAAKSFGSGGRPAGVLTVDRVLTDEQRQQLRTIYDNIQSENSSGTWVLEAGTKYETIDLTPDQLQMIDSRKWQISELARFFLIPPHMIGDIEKSTSWGTGIEQQKLGYLTFTIQPYLKRFETAVASALLNRTDRRKYYIEHNVEGLLRADSKTRAEVNSINAQNGLETRNEIRVRENKQPLPGGDELTVQVNLTDIADLPKVNRND